MGSRESMQRTNGDSEYRKFEKEFFIKRSEKWGRGGAEEVERKFSKLVFMFGKDVFEHFNLFLG